MPTTATVFHHLNPLHTLPFLLVSVITVPLAAPHIIYLRAAINCCRGPSVGTWRDVPSAEPLPWGADVRERERDGREVRIREERVSKLRQREGERKTGGGREVERV